MKDSTIYVLKGTRLLDGSAVHFDIIVDHDLDNVNNAYAESVGYARQDVSRELYIWRGGTPIAHVSPENIKGFFLEYKLEKEGIDRKEVIKILMRHESFWVHSLNSKEFIINLGGYFSEEVDLNREPRSILNAEYLEMQESTYYEMSDKELIRELVDKHWYETK